MKEKVVELNKKEIWEDYDTKSLVKKKINTVREYIPEEISSILDVGCGNGIITNNLAEDYMVTGADLSDIALTYVKGEKIHCSSDSIPVEDKSFEMVFSSEMLEHLPQKTLDGTIAEFKRIAKKYIFITVPYKEHLKTSFIKCRNCNNEFHPYGHLHSFTKDDLSQKFCDEFQLIKHGTHGDKKRYYNTFLLTIKNKIADKWFQTESTVICPNCNNEISGEEKGNLLSKACNLINRIIGIKRPYWLFVVFKRI